MCENDNKSNEIQTETTVAEKALFVEAELEKPPKDYGSIVYFIFLLHGIGVLLPWNVFLTVGNDYFMEYRFQNDSKAGYVTNFFLFLCLFSQLPNLILNTINLFVIIKGSGLIVRVFCSLIVIVSVCIFTILMTLFPLEYPFQFFILTIISVVLLNSANGFYQNSIYGIAANFPWRFTNAIILGNNLCGSLVALIYIIFKKCFNTFWSTFFYFVFTFFIIVGCIITFSILPKFEFYKFYIEKAKSIRLSTNQTTALLDSDKKVENVKNLNSKKAMLKNYISILVEAFPHMLDVFLVFFVTLSIFPTILIDIRDENNVKFDNNFKSLFIFLNFNVFALFGSYIANFIHWPSPKYLRFVVFLRIILIPLFLFCNYIPEGLNSRSLFVLIYNKWAIVVLITLLGLSQGYLSSLSMIYAPSAVHESKQQTAGMVAAFILVFGITVGVFFTYFEGFLFRSII